MAEAEGLVEGVSGEGEDKRKVGRKLWVCQLLVFIDF
jgi:hypothetical protein